MALVSPKAVNCTRMRHIKTKHIQYRDTLYIQYILYSKIPQCVYHIFFFVLRMFTCRIDRCCEINFINEFFFAFQIHDGPNSTSPAFLEQPRYDGGSWTRPVIAATSKYVFLKFIPGPTKGKTFVGFKASYWTVQSKYI